MQHVVVASNVKSLVEFSQQILRQIPNTKHCVPVPVQVIFTSNSVQSNSEAKYKKEIQLKTILTFLSEKF